MQKGKNTSAIILAAGLGSRMGSTETKQTLMLFGKTVLGRCLDAFEHSSHVDSLVIVYREGEFDFVNKECHCLKKPFTLVKGGNCRAESAALGFSVVADAAEYVMIHDAARCLVTPDDIALVAESAYRYGAATASRPVTDTVKKCDDKGVITDTISRSELRLVQTPQAFARDVYSEALRSVSLLDDSITDDNMLVEKIGVHPHCVITSAENIKITAPEDLALAEFIIKKRGELVYE